MISSSSVPANPNLKNLNEVLADIYVRYIALKKEDCNLYYKVFTKIFQDLHAKMKMVDPYYGRYSSSIKFAGSHYDGLRITKPNEYDMDIVINAPVNFDTKKDDPTKSDIIIEPKYPGFVQLRAGLQYQNIHIRDGLDISVNKTAYMWLDDQNYILRSNFINWFKSVVVRAMNNLNVVRDLPSKVIDGVTYTVRTTESGPALTLIIENKDSSFRLDVDLVPALKFPENRWPIGPKYRSIPKDKEVEYWIVVPKPNKGGQNQYDEKRSWRISLHDQERKFIYNSYNLRLTVKFLKKLRDSQKMNAIASYYIKTLFLWEVIEQNDPSFWNNNLAILFKYMLKKFHEALLVGKIAYFWNKDCNLIGNVNRKLLDSYANIVGKLMEALNDRQGHITVAKYLLTSEEYSEFYHFLKSI